MIEQWVIKSIVRRVQIGFMKVSLLQVFDDHIQGLLGYLLEASWGMTNFFGRLFLKMNDMCHS